MVKQPRLFQIPGGNVKYGDIEASRPAAGVALLEIQRPPNNFFDVTLIEDMGGAFEDLDRDTSARALVLASEGKHFCAGANFGDRSGQRERAARTQQTEDHKEGVRAVAERRPGNFKGR